MTGIITKKTVDMLTSDSVSILTQKYIDIDGVQTQVGQNHRCAYTNSESGRKQIEKEPDYIVTAVMALWGDAPTVINEEQKTESE